MIDMGHNNISEFHESVFYGLPSLSILKLDFNKLHSLSAKIFRNNSNFQVLQINDNKIILTDQLLVMPDSLTWLDLRHNQLTNVPLFSA